MSDTHLGRLARARVALEGLSVGDAFGENFFALRRYIDQSVAERRLPAPPWWFTDDTNMALSIYAMLHHHTAIDQDALALSFARHYDPQRGYGRAMHNLLHDYLQGTDWRIGASALFNGTGSFGNGSAMRIAPLGAYFADDLNACAEQARLSIEVTHTHPEAIAGGVAVAIATGVAWQTRENNPRPTQAEFIDLILPFVPASDVKDSIQRARDLPNGATVWQAVNTLGNGSHISCQDTVAFTLWVAGKHLGRYEDAQWMAVSARGDIDTTCAIIGGIVIMSTGENGIPAEWLQRREDLPAWPFDTSD